MALRSRNSSRSGSIWPGYVDVLSALLMVVIFVLLIFTLSQFVFSYILSGQSSELESLHRRIAEISQLLGLEREKNEELTGNVAVLSDQVAEIAAERSSLRQQVEYLELRRIEDREEREYQLRTVASLQQDINALQKVRDELERKIESTVSSLEGERERSGALRDRSKALEARLAEADERTLLAQRKIERRDIRLEALTALVSRQELSLENQQQLRVDAQAEVALLRERLTQLRERLDEIRTALNSSEAVRTAQTEEIRELGRRLNIELARKVNELERYRSDFFGRLRQIIGDNPAVRIEGDRFLLQSELLFASGTAQLGEQGKEQLAKLAGVIKVLIPKIPSDLPWILRVDGHTDRVPIQSGRFNSNWELSTARAVSVVEYFADQGIPQEHMAAAGFSKFHPIDPSIDPSAYQKNRRIEIKLTTR